MNLKKSKCEPAIIWKRINCQRITSINTRPWWVDTWGRDKVRWYWSADTLFWQLSINDNIDVQSASSRAPKVARKWESKHWYACGADGRSVGRSVGPSRDYQIFWDGQITLAMGLRPCARFARAWSSANINSANTDSTVMNFQQLLSLSDKKKFCLIIVDL